MSDDYGPVERRRAKQRERYRKDPAVGRAYQKVRRAKKKGVIVPPANCANCGKAAKRIEGHHADYSRPLDVKFLCVPCHRDTHAVRRRVLTPVAVRLRQQGYGLRAIATTLGVAHRTIREWLNREGLK